MIGFGQKNSYQLMTPTDVVTQSAVIGIISGAAALVGGFDFISEDNYTSNGKFKISANKDSISHKIKIIYFFIDLRYYYYNRLMYV